MILIKSLGLILCSLLMAVQAHGLNILLTNDDGYDHPWIRAVRASLVGAGHQVTLVAPFVNQSGRSAALTLSEVSIDNPEPGIYSVNATPATAVTLGVKDIMAERPDLIVSGTNDGANIGVLSSFSGTVGATVAAQHLVGEPIPAIAISGNRLDGEMEASSETNFAHGRNIAEFLARLVSALEASQDQRGGLLPPGIALNVNYPAVSPEQVKGVGVYRHGRDLRAFFEKGRGQIPGESGNAADSDTEALLQGYITIVPIDGDYTAQGWQEVFPPKLFEGLSPRLEAEKTLN